MAVRPIVATTPLTEFGDVDAATAQEILTPGGQDRDKTFVPGFSEMRIRRDLAVAEHKRGLISAGDIPNLPVNLRWSRAIQKDGNTDNKIYGHLTNGYRLVNKSDVGSEYLKELPGGAQVQPDGSIRNGDCVLMIADGKTAAKNAVRKQAETERRLTGVTSVFEQRMQGRAGPKGDAGDGVDSRTLKGAQPFIANQTKQ